MNLVFGVFDSSEAAARGIERLLNRGCTEARAPADKHPIIINIRGDNYADAHLHLLLHPPRNLYAYVSLVEHWIPRRQSTVTTLTVVLPPASGLCCRRQVRVAVVLPTNVWGGEGCLGAEVGHGYLHRLPQACR